MDLRQHEKWIKDQLEGTQDHVDSNALWADLAEHVPPKKDKRKLFILLFLGMIVIGSGLYFGLMSNDSNHTLNPTISSELSQTQIADLETTINKDDEVNAETSNSVMNTKINNNNSTRELALGVEGINNMTKTTTPINKNTQSFDNQSTTSKNSKTTSKDNNTISNYYTQQAIASTFESEQSKIIVEKNIAVSKIEERISLKTDLINSNKLALITNQIQYNIYGTLREIEAKTKPIWTIGMVHGMNISQESYNIQGIDSDTDISDISTSVPGYSASLFSQYFFNNKWSIEAGLQYSQNINRLSHAYSYRVLNEELGIKDIVIGTNGDINEIEGQIQTFDVYEGEGTWYQFQHSILASLGINYQLFSMNKFRTSVGLGAASNIFSTSRGSSINYQSDNFIIGDADKTNQLPFDIMPYGLIRMDYNIRPRTRIGVQLHYTRNTQTLDLINQTSNLTQNNFNIGLSCSQSINY